MFLRHYIIRTQEHAYSKLHNRLFSNQDMNRGWHVNRVNISKQALKIPTQHNNLEIFPDSFDAKEVLSKPVSTHYWEW